MSLQISQDKLRPGSINIFGLTDPDAYSCFLDRYKVGQGFLRVGALKEDEGRLNLTFVSPQYFEGPTSWTGANFCVATVNESALLYLKLGWIDKTFSREQVVEVLEFLPLFKVVCKGGFQVRIVASMAHISSGRPSTQEITSELS